MKVLVLGGNRFFGKKLTKLLIEANHDVTLLNRGNVDDGFGDKIKRLKCDRTDKEKMKVVLGDQSWDVVVDQVCFDYNEAKEASELFEGKVKHFIFTSSLSVYSGGTYLKEEEFDPKSHQFETKKTMEEDYAEAKRQAEVSFTKYAPFPTTFVRFPMVIGLDDATERFQWHLNKILEGHPIYFPNLEAKMTFISSDQAAEGLKLLVEKPLEGPINVASPHPISMGDLMKLFEKNLDKEIKLAHSTEEGEHSPYGLEQDWYVSCDRLAKHGLTLPAIEEWIPPLVQRYKRNTVL